METRRPRSPSFDCNMEYKVLLIVVVGIVIEASGNPFAEEKMMEETPPACTEDPQVCKGIVDYLNAYNVPGYGSHLLLQVCHLSGLRQSGAWSSMMTDPDRTWGALCPVTCKMCPNAIPEPCSDYVPWCSDYVPETALTERFCDGTDGLFWYKLCAKTCDSCKCSDKHPGCAEWARLWNGNVEFSCNYRGTEVNQRYSDMYQTWCPQTCGSCPQ